MCWYEDSQEVHLLYWLVVCLHLAHILSFVLHLHAVHGQVVPGQAEPLVLPDNHLARADDSVVLLPDESAGPNILHLTVEGDRGAQLCLVCLGGGGEVGVRHLLSDREAVAAGGLCLEE